MIAAGAGVPMHFLAEPEGSTRTTAEAAGGPTYRRFEQRQRYFCALLEDLIGAVLARRGMGDAKVKVTGGDLSARDNAALAVAGSAVASFMMSLRERQVIDDKEMLWMIYLFLGENVDLEDVLRAGEKAGPPKMPPQPAGSPASPSRGGQRKGPSSGYRSGIDAGPDVKVKVDADTGDVKTNE